MRRVPLLMLVTMATASVGAVMVAQPVSAVAPLASSVITVTKLVSTNNGIIFGSNDSAPSGTSLIYKVTAANSGASSAISVQFADAIPRFLTYLPGSGKFATSASTTYAGATVLTEGSGGYSFGVVSGSPTVNYNPGGATGTVASGGLLTLFFRATIDTTAANTIINNAATVNYNDTGGIPQPSVTSSASVTVPLVPSPVLLSSPTAQTITQGTSVTLSYTITGTAAGPDFYDLSALVTPSNMSQVTPNFTTPVGLGGTTLVSPAVAGNSSITVPYDGNPNNADINGTTLPVGAVVEIRNNAYQIASITKNPASNTTTVGMTTPITGASSAGTIVGEQKAFTLAVPSGNVSSGRTGTQSVSLTATSQTANQSSTSQSTPTVMSVINPTVTCAKVTGSVSTTVVFRTCSPISSVNTKAKILGTKIGTGGKLKWFSSRQATILTLSNTSPGRGGCSKHFTERDLTGNVSGGTSTYTQLNDPVSIRICQSNTTGAVSLVQGTVAAL